jgi:hypothetical protein
MDLKFRDLKADEIECRVAQISAKGCSLLLYKDARCDQNILDESVGCMNWERKHTRENANCIVSIWDEDKKMWVSKEDTGTESNTEAEKGLASDSFKRACFNWGIGRELYTAPFIWVSAENCTITNNPKTGKPQCSDRFAVESITIENKKITALSIKNAKTGDNVYTFGKASAKKSPAKKSAPKAEAPAPAETPKTVAQTAPKKPSYPHRNEFLAFCKENELDVAEICKEKNLTKASLDVDFIEALSYAVKLVALKEQQETGIQLPFEI